MPILHIIGRILNRRTGQGLSDLRVELWPLEIPVDKPVLGFVTGREGTFYEELDDQRLEELGQFGHSELYFQIFRREERIASTEQTVVVSLDHFPPDLPIEVDVPPDDEMHTHTISGHVLAQDIPLPKIVVRAYILDGGNERAFDETTSNVFGEYALSYRFDTEGNRQSPDVALEVRAFSPDDGQTLLGKSAPLRHPTEEAQVDVVVALEVPTNCATRCNQ